MSVTIGPQINTGSLLFSLDAGNPKSYSNNVHPIPLDLFAWFTGTSGNCTIERDLVTGRSPVEGIPLKMTITANDPYMASYNAAQYHLAPAAPGQTWTVSVWVKSSVATTAELFLFGDSAAGGAVFTIVDYGAGTVNVTTQWTRVSYSYTFSNAAVARVQVRLDGTNTGAAGTIIWWDGLQIERAPAVTPFNSKLNFGGRTWFNSTNLTTATIFNTTTFQTLGLGSLYFNGINDYALYPNTTYPSAWSDPVSIEAWIRVPAAATWSNGTTTGPIIIRGSYTGHIGIGRTTTNNQIIMSTRGDATTVTAAATITRDTWTHVVGTWDGSNTRIFVNGAQIATSGSTTHTGVPEQDFWRIGQAFAFGGADGNAYTGSISLANVYSKALSQGEVYQKFTATRGRFGV